MYDFEFDIRKFRARSALPTTGRKYEDELSGLYGSDYLSSLRSSIGRSLSVARDVIHESSVEPASYYKAYQNARRERLSQLREYIDDSSDLDSYLKSPANRYYSYNVAPSYRGDYGRGFWYPYYSYPYTNLLQPYYRSPRLLDWNELLRPYRPSYVRPGFGDGTGYNYGRPSTEPRRSYYTPRTYEPPTGPGSFSRKPFDRYSHYYIPKHYPGTPMHGGYIVPTGASFGWRY